MKQVIHLYVKSEKHYKNKGTYGTSCFHITSSDLQEVVGVSLNQKENQIMNMLGNYAEEHGIELKVHDLAHKTERKEARKRGIRKTPTTLIGETKISGVPEIEEIEAAMAVLNESICENSR